VKKSEWYNVIAQPKLSGTNSALRRVRPADMKHNQLRDIMIRNRGITRGANSNRAFNKPSKSKMTSHLTIKLVMRVKDRILIAKLMVSPVLCNSKATAGKLVGITQIHNSSVHR
jgi:hypothetical protein